MHTALLSLLPEPWAEGGSSKWINSYPNRDKQKFIVHPFRTHSWVSLCCLGCANLRLGPWSWQSHHGCAESPPEPQACASASLGRQAWSPGVLLNAPTVPPKKLIWQQQPQNLTFTPNLSTGKWWEGKLQQDCHGKWREQKKRKNQDVIWQFSMSVFPFPSLMHFLQEQSFLSLNAEQSQH